MSSALRCFPLVRLFVLLSVPLVACGANPVRIFLLAGQSNMVGMGSIDHLDDLIHHQHVHEYRKHLWRHHQQHYVVRDDVFIRFNNNTGNLTIARDSGFASPGRFGPEVGFGWTLGDAADDKVLLIKTGDGGRSLGYDFRPPSSGVGSFDFVHPTPTFPYGFEYQDMIADIRDTLANLSQYVPGYVDGDGYELAGFVWFHGWDDVVRWSYVNEYAMNLANLIRDVRHDLAAPNLPAVIGELGMQGDVYNKTSDSGKRVTAIRDIQENTTHLPEFEGNTLFVRTAPYAVTDPSPEERFEESYHYYGRADSYWHIGRALGQGMLMLMNAMQA